MSSADTCTYQVGDFSGQDRDCGTKGQKSVTFQKKDKDFGTIVYCKTHWKVAEPHLAAMTFKVKDLT